MEIQIKKLPKERRKEWNAYSTVFSNSAFCHPVGWKNVLKKLINLVKERGVRGALCEIISRLNLKIRMFADCRFDCRFGVDTSGIIELKNLDISVTQKSAGHRYEPTPASALRYILKRLTIDPSKYTLIDFGSGKGRVLLLASEYPYRRIIGVEFSQNLHRIAENNIKIWNNSKQKCYNIESICIDARDFKLPHDPLVLFFFTPFQLPVASKVINNIQESFNNNPRPIQIIYYGSNQEFIELLAKLNFPYQEIYSRRPLSATKKFKGYIFRSEGRAMHSLSLRYILRDIEGVEQFKIIQKYRDYEVGIVKNDRFSPASEEIITRKIKEQIGKEVSVNLKFADSIEAKKSER